MRHGSFTDEPTLAFERPSASWEHRGRLRIPAEAAQLLERVRDEMERSPESAHAAAVRLVTLLTPDAETRAAGARGGLAPWQRHKIDRYLREHLQRPLRVKQLALLVSLSVSHFCRAFKESYEATPHIHITRLRLALAQQLMSTTREPLSEIALRCGLADQAHLSKLFRRWMGETPNAWRRRTRTLPDPAAFSPRESIRHLGVVVGHDVPAPRLAR